MKTRPALNPNVRAACERVENAAIGAIAECKTHTQRIEFWQTLNEYVSINLANVEGRVGGTAGVAGSLGTTKTGAGG